jgi:flagellar protein FliO/FliZ
MKKTIFLIACCLSLCCSMQNAFAEDISHTSATASLLKMGLGLLVVLVVMVLVAWGLKRAMPNGLGQNAVAKIVGGVSVGSRERVVVVEVAGRWIVVGVAPGQVTSLADISLANTTSGVNAEQAETMQISPDQATQNLMQTQSLPSFAQWFKNSLNKLQR